MAVLNAALYDLQFAYIIIHPRLGRKAIKGSEASLFYMISCDFINHNPRT